MARAPLPPGRRPPERPPGLLIREAEDRDAEPVAALLNHLAARVDPDAPGMTAEAVRRDVLSPSTELRALVAELSGRPVGVAVHLFAYEAAYAARGRYLQDLAVDPAHRRRGIARALIAALARLTRDEGGTFLWWSNMDTMQEGRALYRTICDVEHAVTGFAVTRAAFDALADEAPDR